MTKNEAQRLAAMAHELRPDWPITSLMTFIAKHYSKAYRDVAVALAWIACDPTTVTPARMDESGPWWKATQAGEPTFTTVNLRCTETGHETEPAGRCQKCEQAASEGVDHTAGAAAVRAALRAPSEPRPESRRIA